MDQGRAYADTLVRLKHRHGDDWNPLVEVPGRHDKPEKDVERRWSAGRIFRCQTCSEEVLLEEERPGGQTR